MSRREEFIQELYLVSEQLYERIKTERNITHLELVCEELSNVQKAIWACKELRNGFYEEALAKATASKP